MNLRISIMDSVTPMLAGKIRLLRDKAGLNRAMGVEVQKTTVDYLLGMEGGYAGAKKKKSGAPHSGWFAQAAGKVAAPAALSSSSAEAVLTINQVGMGRAFHDVVITPRSAKMLAIPVHPAAYGKRAAELWDRLHLFIPRGKRFICMAINGVLTPLYILCPSARQSQDRRLLPSNAEWTAAAVRGAVGYLDMKGTAA